jgi:hypothetical protein
MQQTVELEQTAIPGTEPTEAGLVQGDAPEAGLLGGATKPQLQEALATLPAWGVGDSWLSEYERIAVRVAKSMVLPAALNADARNVLAVALAGRELGLGFFESMRNIHIIKGQTALSAELKLALAKRDGLIIDSIDESNGCRIEAHRQDTGEKGYGEFTPEDKKTAKLSGTAWDQYPKDLYWARAVTRLTRRLMPDAKGASFRSAEELSDEVIGDE